MAVETMPPPSPIERTDTDVRVDRVERTPYEVHVDGMEVDSPGMFMCCNDWNGADIQATICGFNRASAESRDDVTCDSDNTEKVSNQTKGNNAAFLDNTLQGITSTVSKEFEKSGSTSKSQNLETIPSSDDSVKTAPPIIEKHRVKSAEGNTEIMNKLDKDLFVGSVKRARYESFKSMIDAASHTYGASSLQVAELYASMGTDLLENNSNDVTSKECAIVLFDEAFHIFQTKSGDSDSRTIDMKVRLGKSLFACGRYDDALQQYCQAVYMREALLGELHPSVSDVWVLIAEVHQKKKKMEMALRANAKVLSGYRSAHGDKHKTVIEVLVTIAKLHVAMGNHDKAEDINKYVRVHSRVKK